MNIANLIALFRIVILPIIAYLIYQETATTLLWAIILLILAIISDIADGYVARKRNEVTKIGSFLDPFADKILAVGLLFVFVLRDVFSLWILLFFIFRDILIAVFRWLSSNENLHIAEKWHGQLMVYSKIAIVLGLLLEEFFVYQNWFNDNFLIFINMFTMLAIFLAVLFAFLAIIYYGLSYWRGLHKRKKMGKKLEKEDLIILANRKARGYKDKYRRRLLRVFAKRRKAPIHYLPHNQKDMLTGSSEHVKKIPHVMIAGGDGSFESALDYKPFHKKSLGFFPLGAGNAYYSYFYRGKRFEYLRSRFNFREIDLDILEVEWEKGKKQTTFLTLGIDSEVARLSKERTVHGFADYVKASWKALMRSKADYDFECKISGKKLVLNNCSNLTLAKIPYYGYGVRSLLGEVNVNDGKVYGLAVMNTHNVFFNKVVRLWGLILGMFNMEKHPLLKLKGKKFEIRSEVPFPVQAGGEFLGYTEWVKVRVIRKQKVLVI
jgi:CDP-diacylglycerol---glycerol-3-phosphate 3-phosphatidyltransferase